MNIKETYTLLQILNVLSFDDNLFRKEFKKIVSWIGEDNHARVECWMVQNQYHERYPDLMNLIKIETTKMIVNL